MKPTTPWGELPILDNVPGVGTIGHELTILSYIAKKAGAALEGADDKEQLTSMQLMSEAEDIYQALGRLKSGGTPEQGELFWTDADASKHNRQQGLAVYLALLEKFHGSSGAGEGKFTTSGISIGEVKLWTTMHILKMIKGDVFEPFPALAAFYARFGALPATQEFVTTGGAMGGPPKQYFKLSYD
jgi:glutathione S-transferase